MIKQEDVDHFSPVLPVVVNLRNQGLQERHWEQIHELIGFEIKGRPEITLGELIDKKVITCLCSAWLRSACAGTTQCVSRAEYDSSAVEGCVKLAATNLADKIEYSSKRTALLVRLWPMRKR